MEELPICELKKQLCNKVTSTNLVMVDIRLITTNKVKFWSKDVDTPINTKILDVIMMTQGNHDKIKLEINKNKLIRVPYRHPNH